MVLRVYSFGPVMIEQWVSFFPPFFHDFLMLCDWVFPRLSRGLDFVEHLRFLAGSVFLWIFNRGFVGWRTEFQLFSSFYDLSSVKEINLCIEGLKFGWLS